MDSDRDIQPVVITSLEFKTIQDKPLAATSVDSPPDGRPSPVFGVVEFHGKEQQWQFDTLKGTIQNLKSGLYAAVVLAREGARVVERARGSIWVVETDDKSRNSIKLKRADLFWTLTSCENYSYITLAGPNDTLNWKWQVQPLEEMTPAT